MREGGSGLLGLDPLLKRFSLPPFLFFWVLYLTLGCGLAMYPRQASIVCILSWLGV